MRYFVILFLMSCLTVTGVFSQSETPRGTLHKGISYREPGKGAYADSICLVDVYQTGLSESSPIVIWFHGGGLTGGRRGIPEGLKNKGVTVVAVGYRLLPRTTIHEILDDAAAAVAWTAHNISKYGGDPSRIYIAGHSAGGYLISLIGLDKRWLKPYGIDPDTVFRALIPYSGQSITHFAVRKQRGLSPWQPVVDDLAPWSHVRKDCPPILIISGDKDKEIYGRYEENAYFWRLFKGVKHPNVEFVELQGFSHGKMVAPAHILTLQYIEQLEKASVKKK